MAKKLTRDEFIRKAQEVHSDKFSYEKSMYKSSRHSITTTCPIHGDFEQTPTSHLSKRGCPQCGASLRNTIKRHTFETFKTKADNVHRGKYEYSGSGFVRSTSKISIKCAVHGEFSQTPEAHLSGRGCPSCSLTGFQPNQPGYIYVLQCDEIIKVGITNLTPDQRARKISLSYGKEFEILLGIKFKSGLVADKIETALLKYLRENYKGVSGKFEGHSECFLNVNYEYLQKIIVKLCSKMLQ